MVTHASNIAALTGQNVGSGDGLILHVSDGRIEVVASFSTPLG